MAKGILTVQSGPADPEREDEYSAWYTKSHIPEVLAIDGFVGARRYRVRDAGTLRAPAATPTFLTIYEIDADDPAVPLDELRTRSADGRMTMSDLVRLDPPPTVAFYELTE